MHVYHIISIKRVSSYFPESQSYYSTFAKLMMKRDLDLSADDDDMMMSTPGSMRLTKRNSLDSERISFVIKQHPLSELGGGFV